MNILQAIILGIIEGITEFLPISSTGHLILSGQVLGLSQTEFLKNFEIAIQLGAILSVVVLYWRRFLDFGNLKKLVVALIPTAIIGLVFYKVVKEVFLESNQIVLWSLLIGGVLLILFEWWQKEHKEAQAELAQISYKQSFLIGLFQSLAIVPGVSRAAATILGGLLVGLKRTVIVEFSFLLAVPTMIGATGLDLVKSGFNFTSSEIGVLLAGFISSFIVAILAIKFLLRFIQSHSFIPFGVYRILAALAFWLLVL